MSRDRDAGSDDAHMIVNAIDSVFPDPRAPTGGEDVNEACSCGSDLQADHRVCERCYVYSRLPLGAITLLFGFVLGSSVARFAPSLLELSSAAPPSTTWARINASTIPNGSVLTSGTSGLAVAVSRPWWCFRHDTWEPGPPGLCGADEFSAIRDARSAGYWTFELGGWTFLVAGDEIRYAIRLPSTDAGGDR